MFIIDAAQGERLVFDIDSAKHGLIGAATYLRLFDEYGREIAAHGPGQAPEESTLGLDAYLEFTAKATGRYYLGVSSIGNTQYDAVTGEGDKHDAVQTSGYYTLRHETVIEQFEVPDVIDRGYWRIGYGVYPPTYGRISSANDVDIYWIEGTYDNTIDFDIDSRTGDGSGLDFYIRLFNSRGRELASSDNGLAPGDVQLGKDPYLRYSFDDGDYYYLGVSTASNKNYDPLKPYTGPNNPTGSLGIYELSTRRYHNILDPVDRKKATPITTNLLHYSDRLWRDDSIDTYSFEAYAGQTIDFDVDTLLNGQNGLNSFLRLFDSAGNQLASNDNAAAPGEPAQGIDAYVRYTFSTTGKYIIGVSNNTNISYGAFGDNFTAGGANSIGSYRLTFVQPFANPIDEDDTIGETANSTRAELDGVVINDELDVDMFAYTVSQDESTVVFTTTTDPVLSNSSGLRTCMRLFDGTGQDLAISCSQNVAATPYTTSITTLRYIFAKAGRYYVGISSLNNRVYDPITGTGDQADGLNAVGVYTGRVRDYGSDRDDQIQEAPLFRTIINGFLAVDYDVELYRVPVSAGSVLDFDIDLPASEHWDPLIRLFASDGTELARNDNAVAVDESELGLDSYLRYSFPLAGNYYIGVSFAANKSYDAVTGRGDIPHQAELVGSFYLNITAAKTAAPYASLTLTTNAASLPEDYAQATATVTRLNSDTSAPMTVYLVSSDNNSATMPATVTIPSGQLSTSFPINVVRDESRGTRVVTLSATAAGYNAINTLLRVVDVDGQSHNKQLPADTNFDGLVTAMDALLIINYLNSGYEITISTSGPPYLDVNADGLWTALDALLVINRLNSQVAAEGEPTTLADRQLVNWLDCEDAIHKSRNRSRMGLR